MFGKRRDGLEGKPRVDGKQITRDFSAFYLNKVDITCLWRPYFCFCRLVCCNCVIKYFNLFKL